MAIVLQIIGFHNCQGYSQKVEKALRKIGVKLVEIDRESGNVTISSVENPEVIRYALERELKKPVVIMSRDLVPANQNPNPVVSHHYQAPAAIRVSDLHALGQVVLRLARDLDGVEITNSNTTRINFIRRQTPLVVRDVEYAPQPRSPPWVATEPSAPPMPTAKQAVNGYPEDFYGVPRTRSHDDQNGWCTIM
ncbi:hypothetical protein L1987_75371 [Smallanthus sonchifolius]|uniref:Uncharacterized protein n=1 Tax=Smallanthus sonchifolius TaxID=185202 RepID=A0ACB9A705_9ASTR|nr:hypothetical protein L1987_75371 [Smallanthus sonchifolius]